MQGRKRNPSNASLNVSLWTIKKKKSPFNSITSLIQVFCFNIFPLRVQLHISTGKKVRIEKQGTAAEKQGQDSQHRLMAHA